MDSDRYEDSIVIGSFWHPVHGYVVKEFIGIGEAESITRISRKRISVHQQRIKLEGVDIRCTVNQNTGTSARLWTA